MKKVVLFIGLIFESLFAFSQNFLVHKSLDSVYFYKSEVKNKPSSYMKIHNKGSKTVEIAFFVEFKYKGKSIEDENGGMLICLPGKCLIHGTLKELKVVTPSNFDQWNIIDIKITPNDKCR